MTITNTSATFRSRLYISGTGSTPAAVATNPVDDAAWLTLMPANLSNSIEITNVTSVGNYAKTASIGSTNIYGQKTDTKYAQQSTLENLEFTCTYTTANFNMLNSIVANGSAYGFVFAISDVELGSSIPAGTDLICIHAEVVGISLDSGSPSDATSFTFTLMPRAPFDPVAAA